MSAISSLVACLASTSSRMKISNGSQVRYHSRTFSGTPLTSHASEESVGLATDGQLVSLPGQRTVCASINCGPSPPRIFLTASEIVACTVPESRPSICCAGTLYAFGRSVNGKAAMVDDWAAPVARPAPYLPLFSQRKRTGSFQREARFSASGAAPSSSAPSPKRQTVMRPFFKAFAAYAVPVASGIIPATTAEVCRKPREVTTEWNEPPLPLL